MFIGTPPKKPLKCKVCSNQLGALMSDLRADPTGEEFCILCAIFNFVRSDIIETSFLFCSQPGHLSFRIHCSIVLFREIKNPAHTR